MGERIKGVGRVEGVSSLTHQAEVCSLAHYKSSERGFGRRRGKGQIKTTRKTKTLWEGDGCGLQGREGERLFP